MDVEGSGEDSLSTTTEVVGDILTSTLHPGEYALNPYRVAFLGVKGVLAILVTVLTLSLRRDFVKSFLFFLLLPILGELALDVFIEIKDNILAYPSSEQFWSYYYGNYSSIHIRTLPNHAIEITEDLLKYYSTYTIFYRLSVVSMISFIVNDWIFWSLLFSSLVLMNFAYRAVLRPEEIPYVPFWPAFIKTQLAVVIMSGLDVLFALWHENVVTIALSSLVKITAIIEVACLLLMIIGSVFLLCRSLGERTKLSTFVFVRSSKSRVLWISLFLLLVHVFTFPYILWAVLSVWKDIANLFEVDQVFDDHLASDAFVLHLSLLPFRPFVLLLSSLLLLPPLRMSLFRCCRRDD